MPVIHSEYPKFIEVDGKEILVQSEEEVAELAYKAEKEELRDSIKALGKHVDLRHYPGEEGLLALRQYFAALQAPEPGDPEASKDGNGSDDS